MRPRTAQPFYLGLIALLCLAAVVAIIALLSGNSDRTNSLITTVIGLFVYCSTALSGLALRQKGGSLPLGLAVVLSSVVAFALWVILAWNQEDYDEYGYVHEDLIKAVGVSLVFSLALAYASVLMIRARVHDTSVVRVIRAGALTMDAVLAMLLTIAIFDERSSHTYYQWVGAVAVLLTLGTLLIPIIRRARLKSV